VAGEKVTVPRTPSGAVGTRACFVIGLPFSLHGGTCGGTSSRPETAAPGPRGPAPGASIISGSGGRRMSDLEDNKGEHLASSRLGCFGGGGPRSGDETPGLARVAVRLRLARAAGQAVELRATPRNLLTEAGSPAGLGSSRLGRQGKREDPGPGHSAGRSHTTLHVRR